MKLFKLEQTTMRGYDTYDSLVVVAKNVKEAKSIRPDKVKWEDVKFSNSEWCNSIEDVTVTYLGEAGQEFTKSSVIIASFNAG